MKSSVRFLCVVFSGTSDNRTQEDEEARQKSFLSSGITRARRKVDRNPASTGWSDPGPHVFSSNEPFAKSTATVARGAMRFAMPSDEFRRCSRRRESPGAGPLAEPYQVHSKVGREGDGFLPSLSGKFRRWRGRRPSPRVRGLGLSYEQFAGGSSLGTLNPVMSR